MLYNQILPLTIACRMLYFVISCLVQFCLQKSVPVSVQELFFLTDAVCTRSYKTISRKIIKYYPYKKKQEFNMKKIWNKFQSLAVAKKLLALSLVMSIVPICCILVLNYQLSGSVVRTQTGELIQANLEQKCFEY